MFFLIFFLFFFCVFFFFCCRYICFFSANFKKKSVLFLFIDNDKKQFSASPRSICFKDVLLYFFFAINLVIKSIIKVRETVIKIDIKRDETKYLTQINMIRNISAILKII